MRKSYLKLMIFDIILIIVLLLNSFILSILSGYWRLIIFLAVAIIAFKLLFGFEKDNHRYIKDIIFNIIIIYLVSFIIYYLLGIIIGFVRTETHYSLYGFKNLIFPYIAVICLKEFLRYQILTKSEKSKLLIAISIILFVLFDITNSIRSASFDSKYMTFIFFAVNLLPAISNNVIATFIAKKVGYRPNILWLTISGLYYSLLPIVPNSGVYIGSMIKFLFPIVLAYDIYNFFVKRERNVPIRGNKKTKYFSVSALAVFVAILVYFTSGFFRFYAIAIATGSMTPNILKGDVVVIDKKFDPSKLKVGQVVAHRYESKVIVHRLVDIVKVGEEYYFYTKGDANNAVDNYIIYEDMLVGTVKIRLPYVGYPTVWLNEL